MYDIDSINPIGYIFLYYFKFIHIFIKYTIITKNTKDNNEKRLY